MTEVYIASVAALPALIYMQTRKGVLAQLIAALTWLQTLGHFMRVWLAASRENRKHFWALAIEAQRKDRAGDWNP